MMMNDRRGHRKLRLTSRKHFKPKPKGPLKEQQQPVLDFKLSLPLAAYTEAPVKSLDILHGRLKKCVVLFSTLSCFVVAMKQYAVGIQKLTYLARGY